MNNVRIAFLTGASCAGKSKLSQKLVTEKHLRILENDRVIFGPLFRKFHSHDTTLGINPLSGWAHLRISGEFDADFRHHHLDWYAEHSLGQNFVAEGWIYAFKEWRQMACEAFSMVPQTSFELKMFVLRPEFDEFCKRYIKRMPGHDPGFPNLPIEKQRDRAAKHYDKFNLEDLHKPDLDENIEYEESSSDEDLLNSIVKYCK